jgi:hypothetical protein
LLFGVLVGIGVFAGGNLPATKQAAVASPGPVFQIAYEANSTVDLLPDDKDPTPEPLSPSPPDPPSDLPHVEASQPPADAPRLVGGLPSWMWCPINTILLCSFLLPRIVRDYREEREWKKERERRLAKIQEMRRINDAAWTECKRAREMLKNDETKAPSSVLEE